MKVVTQVVVCLAVWVAAAAAAADPDGSYHLDSRGVQVQLGLTPPHQLLETHRAATQTFRRDGDAVGMAYGAARMEPRDSSPQYAWAYEVAAPSSGDRKSAREERRGDVVVGQYSLVEPDGSYRVVDYFVRPDTGFHATINKDDTPEALAQQYAVQYSAQSRRQPLAPTQIHDHGAQQAIRDHFKTPQLRDQFHSRQPEDHFQSAQLRAQLQSPHVKAPIETTQFKDQMQTSQVRDQSHSLQAKEHFQIPQFQHRFQKPDVKDFFQGQQFMHFKDQLQSPQLKEQFQSPQLRKQTPTPQTEDHFQTPQMNEHFQTPQIKEPFQTPQMKEQFQTPQMKMKEQFQTPHMKEQFQTPQVKAQVQTPQIQEQFQAPQMKEQVQTPRMKEQFQTPQIKEQVQTPRMKEQIQTPQMKEQLQSSQFKQHFQSQQFKNEFKRPQFQLQFQNQQFKEQFQSPQFNQHFQSPQFKELFQNQQLQQQFQSPQFRAQYQSPQQQIQISPMPSQQFMDQPTIQFQNPQFSGHHFFRPQSQSPQIQSPHFKDHFAMPQDMDRFNMQVLDDQRLAGNQFKHPYFSRHQFLSEGLKQGRFQSQDLMKTVQNQQSLNQEAGRHQLQPQMTGGKIKDKITEDRFRSKPSKEEHQSPDQKGDRSHLQDHQAKTQQSERDELHRDQFRNQQNKDDQFRETHDSRSQFLSTDQVVGRFNEGRFQNPQNQFQNQRTISRTFQRENVKPDEQQRSGQQSHAQSSPVPGSGVTLKTSLSTFDSERRAQDFTSQGHGNDRSSGARTYLSMQGHPKLRPRPVNSPVGVPLVHQ
ncbi:chromatin modification-related protein eaf-1-like [Portunus trituberculatus]|nr:chromatin modification-related protein eaf-1-like [Portunus trituberculatus]